MDGNMFNDLGKGLGLYAGALFGIPMVGLALFGGLGWWSLLAWPASVAFGLVAGAIMDGM